MNRRLEGFLRLIVADDDYPEEGSITLLRGVSNICSTKVILIIIAFATRRGYIIINIALRGKHLKHPLGEIMKKK